MRTFNSVTKCTAVFLLIAFLAVTIQAVNIRRIQDTVDIRSRAFDSMMEKLEDTPASAPTSTTPPKTDAAPTGAVVDPKNASNAPAAPLVGAPNADIKDANTTKNETGKNETDKTDKHDGKDKKDEKHDYLENNTCLNLYDHALKACKDKSKDDKERAICVQWAMSSNARCLHSCYVQTEICGVEARDHLRIHLGFKAHCKGELCKEFAGEEERILAEFANCFTRKPACEDPQVVAFNFFRFGGRAFNEADKTVVPAEKLAKFLKAGNATDAILEKLYKCSYDSKCVAKHSKELEGKKGEHKDKKGDGKDAKDEKHEKKEDKKDKKDEKKEKKEKHDEKDKKHEKKDDKKDKKDEKAAAPTKRLAAAEANSVNGTNKTLIQLPGSEGESYMQVAVRFVKSLFS